jgi:hypothetical protein
VSLHATSLRRHAIVSPAWSTRESQVQEFWHCQNPSTTPISAAARPSSSACRLNGPVTRRGKKNRHDPAYASCRARQAVDESRVRDQVQNRRRGSEARASLGAAFSRRRQCAKADTKVRLFRHAGRGDLHKHRMLLRVRKARSTHIMGFKWSRPLAKGTFSRSGSSYMTFLVADNIVGYPDDWCVLSRYRCRLALRAHAGLLAVAAPLSLGRSRSCRGAKVGEQF